MLRSCSLNHADLSRFNVFFQNPKTWLFTFYELLQTFFEQWANVRGGTCSIFVIRRSRCVGDGALRCGLMAGVGCEPNLSLSFNFTRDISQRRGRWWCVRAEAADTTWFQRLYLRTDAQQRPPVSSPSFIPEITRGTVKETGSRGHVTHVLTRQSTEVAKNETKKASTGRGLEKGSVIPHHPTRGTAEQSLMTGSKLYCFVTGAWGCKQLAGSRYAAAFRSRVELTTCCWQVGRLTIPCSHDAATNTAIHRANWPHIIYGHHTIAILWVKHDIICGVRGEYFVCCSNYIKSVFMEMFMITNLSTKHI